MGKRHYVSNISINGEGDEAFVTSDLIVMEVEESPRVVATARYDRSRVVRTPGGWKFAHRRLDLDPGFAKYMAEQQTTQLQPT